MSTEYTKYIARKVNSNSTLISCLSKAVKGLKDGGLPISLDSLILDGGILNL